MPILMQRYAPPEMRYSESRITFIVGQGTASHTFIAQPRAICQSSKVLTKLLINSRFSLRKEPVLRLPDEEPATFHNFLMCAPILKGFQQGAHTPFKGAHELKLQDYIELYQFGERMESNLLQNVCLSDIKKYVTGGWWNNLTSHEYWVVCKQSKLRLFFAYTFMELYMETEKDESVVEDEVIRAIVKEQKKQFGEAFGEDVYSCWKGTYFERPAGLWRYTIANEKLQSIHDKEFEDSQGMIFKMLGLD